MDIKGVAAGLAQAFGSGKTGALAISAGVGTEVSAVQAKLDANFNQIGALLGRFGGDKFTDAIAAGARRGASEKQQDLIVQATGFNVAPEVLYIGLALAVVFIAWIWGKRG